MNVKQQQKDMVNRFLKTHYAVFWGLKDFIVVSYIHSSAPWCIFHIGIGVF